MKRGCMGEDGWLWAEEGGRSQASQAEPLPNLSLWRWERTACGKQPSLWYEAGLEIPISWDKELSKKKHFYLLIKYLLIIEIFPAGFHFPTRQAFQLNSITQCDNLLENPRAAHPCEWKLPVNQTRKLVLLTFNFETLSLITPRQAKAPGPRPPYHSSSGQLV